jgi:cell division protein FtsW
MFGQDQVRLKPDHTGEGQRHEAGRHSVARKLKFDRVLFIATFLLVCASVVMVYSASAGQSARHGDSYEFALKQGLFAALGLGILGLVMRIDYRTYRNDAFVWGLVGAVALLLVMVFLTSGRNGARRWLQVAGLGIQPSELAKLACILFTALILERRMHRIDEIGYSLLPIGIVVGTISALILFEPDFGTAASLLLVVGVMVFAAGLNYRYIAGGAAILLPTALLVLLLASYRLDRLKSYWNPWADPSGDGYQAIQSMIAVGTGGLFGKGLTYGVQKMGFLPEPHNDFIYAVIGEELGLIGAIGILLCFCLIAWRGLRIALRSEDAFGAFVAIGVTTMICAQALINIGVVLSLLPTKGIPLPLVSAGGSSLLVSMLGIGVLLNISQHETAEV